MKRKYLLVAIPFFITIGFVYVYLVYFADKVAHHINYFVSLGVVPFLSGAAIGYLGSLVLSEKETSKIARCLYIPISCGLLALAPVFYTVFMMMVMG